MADATKDTIYIDIDDEITAIIDKLQNSSSKIVALVLPKRAVALQSIVNMKLLKRAAEEAGKNAVLITSEAGILPLAGATGLYVAKNLQSKPVLPSPPESQHEAEEVEAAVDGEAASEMPKSATALAGSAALDDTVELSETVPAAKGKKSAKNKPKNKKDKTPKIPNFELFRKKLFLVLAGIILLIIGWYLAVFVAPKANIVIETETEAIESNFDFTASASADSLSESDLIAPAQVAKDSKNESEIVPTTGQKDLGKKASGTVTMFIKCEDVNGAPPTVPAGTGVSAGGLTYITQSSTSLTTPNFNNGNCFSGSTKVVAQNKGEQYNIGAQSYSVSGFSDVSATGSAMTGGSSKIAKVVSAQDVADAKEKLKVDEKAIKSELKQKLEDNDMYAIEESFKKSNETTIPTPAIGEESSEVEVSYSADFTMVGVKRDDMKALITESIKDQIDTDRQEVQDDGLDDATFTLKDTKGDGSATISLQTQAQVGPNLNIDELKAAVAGQKKGDTENAVLELPGVKDVQVNYTPFWVNVTPKKVTKITIELKTTNQ